MLSAASTSSQNASGGDSQGNPGPYVDDLFSAYTYTGQNSQKVINNGIDLAGNGGMVLLFSRTTTEIKSIFDTVRGVNKRLAPSAISAQSTLAGISAFSSDGFVLGGAGANATGVSYGSLTFRKASKFFDVVTYVGNGVGRSIPHSLGVVPGMVWIKAVDSAKDWVVYHNSFAVGVVNEFMALNLPNMKAVTPYSLWPSAPDAQNINIGAYETLNGPGITYVAYIFAHDPSENGNIQCGQLLTDGYGSFNVDLGWEPQAILAKPVDGTGTGWLLLDSSRDLSYCGRGVTYLNTATAETKGTTLMGVTPNASGFKGMYSFGENKQWIYMAIRRPNKPATKNTDVYSAHWRTGNNSAIDINTVGFAPDVVLSVPTMSSIISLITKLKGRGTPVWLSGYLGVDKASAVGYDLAEFTPQGVKLGPSNVININYQSVSSVNHFFKRAPGILEEIVYTGNGDVGNIIPHNLGVQPEFIFTKAVTVSGNHVVDFRDSGSILSASPSWIGSSVTSGLSLSNNLKLWSSRALDSYLNADSIAPHYLGGSIESLNTAGVVYSSLLFASKAGISKIGVYTGNGNVLGIGCGFTTGARFILIKPLDRNGDWFTWTSIRGIIAGNDPHVALNTNNEVTGDDSIDPHTGGFVVNQSGVTNINVINERYLFLAFA